MSLNKFVLKHHHIEVDYTIGITPGLPALIYKDGPNVKTFRLTKSPRMRRGADRSSRFL